MGRTPLDSDTYCPMSLASLHLFYGLVAFPRVSLRRSGDGPLLTPGVVTAATLLLVRNICYSFRRPGTMSD